MKATMFRSLPVMATSLLAAGPLNAQEQNTPPRNRIGINYRVGYNVSASFSGIGGFAARSNPGPLTGGADHEYDDGYVRVDSTQSGLGLTWNWGFDNANQVSGDNLFLSSTRGLGGESESSADWHHGIEITYARELGTIGRLRWGIEGAGNFLNVNIRDSATAGTTVARTTDTYALGGVIPFDPITSQNPYQGTFFGPGPLIADAPIARNEQIIAGAGTSRGQRELEANLYGLRVGPYVEFPLSARWAVGLNGGLALVFADSSFRFQESVTAAGVPGASASGSDSDTAVLPGGYVGANVSVQLNAFSRVSAGVQYQHVGDVTQKVKGRSAKLDLGESLFLTLGLNFSF